MTPEIRAFEYALGMVAVLVGLAVADIAMSFHRLMRRRTTVAWDPLTLIAALYALFMAIGMWFDLWAVKDVAQARHYFFFLSVIGELFVLFLIAASSLPDEAGETDLREYYAQNRRYFWSLVAIFWFAYFWHGVYFTSATLQRLPLAASTHLIIQMILPFALAVILLMAKSRLVHYLGLAASFGWMLYYYGSATIN
jgi:uncharacterized membrane protein